MIITISEVKIIWFVLSDVYTRLHMMIYNHEIKIIFIFYLWRSISTRSMASSFLRFINHTQRRITVCRTPLDE
jgi:hypothetical protein